MNTLFLRIITAIILLTHSLPSILTGDVNNFGKLFLDPIGFAPFGVFLAWAVKLSHLVSALALLANKYVKPACLLFIAVLVGGIFLVHLKDGWFVVGGGRNGVEYNVLLIIVCLSIMFPQGSKAIKAIFGGK
jgi:putative oxidoreductase